MALLRPGATPPGEQASRQVALLTRRHMLHQSSRTACTASWLVAARPLHMAVTAAAAISTALSKRELPDRNGEIDAPIEGLAIDHVNQDEAQHAARAVRP